MSSSRAAFNYQYFLRSGHNDEKWSLCRKLLFDDSMWKVIFRSTDTLVFTSMKWVLTERLGSESELDNIRVK